jgi:nucleoside-diphosphate-sugar epimerase
LSNNRMLVTGANGFVGSSLCAALAKKGFAVRAALRDPAKFAIADCEIVKVPTLAADTDWGEALHGVTTVIHLAARVHVMQDNASNPLDEFRRVNVAGTEQLARSAAANRVKRLVYVSSIKVNGEETREGRKYAETDAPDPQDPYGVSKCEAGLALQRVAAETGLEVVIIRPPLVYGPGVKGNFVQMLKVLVRGTPLPLASVKNLRSLVYVGNLVDALIVCATHPYAAGQTYLVSDGEDISTSGLLRQLADAMGCPSRLFSCPPGLLKLAGLLSGKSNQVERLLGSLQVDSGKIRRELNWAPPYTLQQGLQKTADWYSGTCS